jgi:aspartyl-tRNA(Asn)/glutamyl-tRNA(Gln) amidotransferase subunit A
MPPSAEPRPEGLGVAEAARRIRDGLLSPVALVEACLARIERVDPEVQAWVHVDAEGALAAARALEREARAGKVRGPLHGVPAGIKDVFHVAGMPTRAGAATFAHTIPAADAAAVARLRAAGAVILGKTHTTQFAFRDPAPTRNPWNPAHTPGGSSSGSAAAVAARLVPLALGTQTVGSVLRPAAYCGVVGFKGTHGLVPIDGVIPLAWSFDHVGVFARSVEDASLAHAALVVGGAAASPLGRPPRLALAPELLRAAGDEVAAGVSHAADAFARAGASVVEVKLPASYAALAAAGQTVVQAEAATYHEPSFRLHADAFGPGIRAAVEAGLQHSATAYIRANRARLQFRADVMPLLAAHDALLGPVAPTTAPAGLASTGDASLCAPWSWAGAPSASLPSGLSPAGLPYAIQLTRASGVRRPECST